MPIKKVAFIVKYFPTVSETFIVNQINGLFDAGYDVQLYAYQKVEVTVIHESLKRYNLLDKVHYFEKPPTSKMARSFLFFKWIFAHFFKINWRLLFKSINVFTYGKEAYTLKLFFETQWFLLPCDFHLIHAHFGMNGNRIARLKAFGILPNTVKLINTFHGYDLSPDKLALYPKNYKDLLQQADAFTVNTPYLQGILKQVNLHNKPCYVLPVGLDTSFFVKDALQAKDTKSFDLVFCGKLIALKGPDIAIDTLKMLHDKAYTQVRLHIIGTGERKEHLKKQVLNYGLERSVFFHGSLSQLEIRQHFANSDAFLLPGRYDVDTGRAETQGLVVQEAQAMQLPVIISDVGGMKYGLLSNESGFVVAEGDVDGFASAIEKLILNPELKKAMGKKGRDYVAQYDTKILVAQLQRIYEEIV
jgi:colanic acid/amylovoran biosynthesis glycosyltransferase